MNRTLAEVVKQYADRSLPLTQSEAHRDETILSLPRADLLAGVRFPDAAWSGLLLLAGCWEESHQASQELSSAEGGYWHGIAHRIEPDSFNAGYWFQRVGRHPIFGELHREAQMFMEHSSCPWRLGAAWEPLRFIEWCDEARSAKGGALVQTAVRIQQAECRLLLEFCIS